MENLFYKRKRYIQLLAYKVKRMENELSEIETEYSLLFSQLSIIGKEKDELKEYKKKYKNLKENTRKRWEKIILSILLSIAFSFTQIPVIIGISLCFSAITILYQSKNLKKNYNELHHMNVQSIPIELQELENQQQKLKSEIKSRYENIDIIYQTILEINQDIKWLEAKTGISSEQSFVSTIEVENTKKYVDAIDLEEDKCYSSKERKKSKMKAK